MNSAYWLYIHSIRRFFALACAKCWPSTIDLNCQPSIYLFHYFATLIWRNVVADLWIPRKTNLKNLLSAISVQLCRPDPGTAGHDSETAGTGDGLQDHGARQGLDEGQEEGEFLRVLIFLAVSEFNGRVYLHVKCRHGVIAIHEISDGLSIGSGASRWRRGRLAKQRPDFFQQIIQAGGMVFDFISGEWIGFECLQ